MSAEEDDYAADDSTFEQHGDDPRPSRGSVPPAAPQALPLPLDLNDPVVENEVADAIRRLAPEGAYVPLSARYPWRFAEPSAGQQETNLVDAVVVALRGSADVHEAERIPHLVALLRVLADALERGALVPDSAIAHSEDWRRMWEAANARLGRIARLCSTAEGTEVGIVNAAALREILSGPDPEPTP